MQSGTNDASHSSRPRHRVEQEDDRAWLHDTVLQVLEYLATGGYGSCTDAQRLMQVAARAADDLREVIDGSELADVPTPFVDGLHSVVEEARDLSGIDVRIDLSGPVDRIDPIVGGEIVAVVREALNNIRKHSGARVAFVECDVDADRLEVRVVDDGHGFDPLTVREGLGIRCSMRQRMARCGGSIAIASAPGRGVVVRITSGTTNPRMTESVA
jgi:signal transduction histidine kinase